MVIVEGSSAIEPTKDAATNGILCADARHCVQSISRKHDGLASAKDAPLERLACLPRGQSMEAGDRFFAHRVMLELLQAMQLCLFSLHQHPQLPAHDLTVDSVGLVVVQCAVSATTEDLVGNAGAQGVKAASVAQSIVLRPPHRRLQVVGGFGVLLHEEVVSATLSFGKAVVGFLHSRRSGQQIIDR
jgi:hypothetical protein